MINKSELINGSILHCTSKTFKSKLIGLLIGSKINHSAIYTVINGFGVVADVDKNNVIRLTRFEKWIKEYNFTTSNVEVSKSNNFIHSLIGCDGFNFESNFNFFKPRKKIEIFDLDFIREELILAVFGRMNLTPSEIEEYCFNLTN